MTHTRFLSKCRILSTKRPLISKLSPSVSCHHFHTNAISLNTSTESEPTQNARRNREILQEFIDPTLYEGKPMDESGRAWDLNELRRKSFDDLHRLYFILIKERNRLHTAKLFYKNMGKLFEQTERITNCKKSMTRIKQVIQEREDLARQLAWEEFVEKREAGEYQWPVRLDQDNIQEIVEKYDLWTLKSRQNHHEE